MKGEREEGRQEEMRRFLGFGTDREVLAALNFGSGIGKICRR